MNVVGCGALQPARHLPLPAIMMTPSPPPPPSDSRLTGPVAPYPRRCLRGISGSLSVSAGAVSESDPAAASGSPASRTRCLQTGQTRRDRVSHGSTHLVWYAAGENDTGRLERIKRNRHKT